MKQLHSWAKKFYLYPLLMAVVCLALAITVVTQNITIGVILDRLLTNKSTHWLPIVTLLAVALLMRASLDLSLIHI